MKKKLLSVLLAGVMVVSLAACGGGSGSGDSGSSSDSGSKDGGSASGGEKEIIYWNIGTESPDKDVITKAVEKFNSETESGYTVTSIPTQNDTYKEKLVVVLASARICIPAGQAVLCLSTLILDSVSRLTICSMLQILRIS